jgi:uncharacterized protein (DUF2236 family)
MTDMTSYLGWKIDFTGPSGEASLLPPSSVQWRIYKNQVALGIGGVAAVLMEFADPRIRSGVWDHSTYKIDPIGRSRRTGVAAMVGVYGPASAARRVILGITNMHARVGGKTPGGVSYQALDPELLNWVSATAGYGFLNAYDRFVAPITPSEKARFFAEGIAVARLYGVRDAPRSTLEFEAIMARLASGFEPHPIVEEFLAIIQSGKAAPAVPRFLHRALARASVSILPPLIRERLRLGAAYDLTGRDRIALKLVAALAERRMNPASPPCQASVRLGLPADFLYRSRTEQTRLLDRLSVAAPAAARAA